MEQNTNVAQKSGLAKSSARQKAAKEYKTKKNSVHSRDIQVISIIRKHYYLLNSWYELNGNSNGKFNRQAIQIDCKCITWDIVEKESMRRQKNS